MAADFLFNHTMASGNAGNQHTANFQLIILVSPQVGVGYTTGDIAWVITSSALVWLMLPGVGFFYSGLTGPKSALSMIMLSFIAMSVGAVQVLKSICFSC